SVEDQVVKMSRGGGAPAVIPAPAAAPAESLAEPAAVSGAPAEAPVQAPRTDERTERGDRDRRGRRSRRRRPNRGRGLPESKFYNPAQREAEPAAAASEPVEEVETVERAAALAP